MILRRTSLTARSLAADRAETATVAATAGQPVDIDITALRPDTACRYRLNIRRRGEAVFDEGPASAFRTARSTGGTFTFTLQGDSHPERLGRMFDPDLYARTMANIAADRPDFHMTIGDDFSLDPLINNGALSQAAVDEVYVNQRTFLGEVGPASPLFMVNGNHETVERSQLDGTPTSAPVMAGSARVRFFPLPAPGGFYSGDAEEVEHLGLPRDYYAWTWGEALFVVFDPYWHSPAQVDPVRRNAGRGRGRRARDWWGMSIGDTQYRWLKTTLERSEARYKFVFGHHILGTGRGGIEMADLYEWGGSGQDGAWEFDRYRPQWEMPLHQLFVHTGVTIFFFGHDHLFARQGKDGVIYQQPPMPADPTYQAFNREAYRSGDVLTDSGHLRVSVSPQNARVDYVRSFLPRDEATVEKNGSVAFTYSVIPRG